MGTVSNIPLKEMAKMRNLAFYFAAMVLVTVPVAGQGPKTQRLQFDKGQSEAQIQGTIQGYQTAGYLLQAAAGQTMTVSLETQHTATYFNIFAPGSQPGRDQALFIGETGGMSFEGKLTIPGDYLIQVYMMRSAARRKETAAYALNVRTEGTADPSAPGPKAGPWPVDTDASGDLSCSTGGMELDRQCPFRVKRNTYGATIWVTHPGELRDPEQMTFEDLRTVYFEKVGSDKESFSTNDASEVTWQRENDNWIVTIGDERYRIPDAVVYGG